MAYKNLLVVLDADQSSRERISYAAALAARFDAHLVGLYLTVSSLTRDEYALLDIGILDISFFSDPAKSREETEKTRALFEEVTSRQGVSAEWRTASGDYCRPEAVSSFTHSLTRGSRGGAKARRTTRAWTVLLASQRRERGFPRILRTRPDRSGIAPEMTRPTVNISPATIRM